MRIVERLFDDVGMSLADDRIRAVGHRVVQGGARYSQPVLIDSQVRWGLPDLGKLAPLHNYGAVEGIDGARQQLPEVPQLALFGPALFHAPPGAPATHPLTRAAPRPPRG